jgi:sporulation protein YlmC with PRC-barrel domain
MDEGLPIAYPLLEKGVPVITSDGEQVGTVHHVVAAQEQDIFHGLVISTTRLGLRFVPAEDVASLHEHGVDLRIDAAEVAALPVPGGGAPSYTEDPEMSKWSHWSHRLSGRNDWNRES